MTPVTLADLDRALAALDGARRGWVALPTGGLIDARALRRARSLAKGAKGRVGAAIAIEVQRSPLVLVDGRFKPAWTVTPPASITLRWPAHADTGSRGATVRFWAYAEPRGQKDEDRVVSLLPIALAAPSVPEAAPAEPAMDEITRRRLAVNAALGVGSRFMVAQ